MAETLVRKENTGRTAQIVFSSAGGNLFSEEMMSELLKLLTEAETDRSCDTVLIRSDADGVFSAGHNIADLQRMDYKESRKYNQTGQAVINLVRSMKKPVIAAVDGDCFGPAFELVLACDFAFATEKSRFAFPETEYGIIPGFGGTQLASKKVYESFAKFLVFTGDSAEPAELYEKGILARVFADAQAMTLKLAEFTEMISKRSAYAIGLAKETINNSVDMDFDKGLLLEQNAFTLSFSSYDKNEGIKAFIEKREPVFKDRWEDYRF
jgi:enoyl-CoA hydratase